MMDTDLERQMLRILGAGKHIIAEVRRDLGFRSTRTRGSENRSRVAEAFDANPEASGSEIAKVAGVTERYAQDVIKRLKWEKNCGGR